MISHRGRYGGATAPVDEAGHTLGWVPKEKHEVPARLMDAGKLLFGRLKAKGWVAAG